MPFANVEVAEPLTLKLLEIVVEESVALLAESSLVERLVALIEAPVIEPPVIEAFEIRTPLSWSILFVCAVTL